MNAVLKRAQDALRISDVTLRRCNIDLNDKFDHFDLEELDSKIQMFREVVTVYSLNDAEASQRVSSVEQEIEPKSGAVSYYIFRYAVGVRLVSLSEDETEDEPLVYLVITAEFDARYRATSILTDEEIQSFSKDNVGINVWPFWREHVYSACGKLGLKKIIPVPFYRITD